MPANDNYDPAIEQQYQHDADLQLAIIIRDILRAEAAKCKSL